MKSEGSSWMNFFTETIATDLYKARLKRLAHLYRLPNARLEQVWMAFTNLLIDHKNHCAAHFKTSKFAALFK